MPEEDGSQPSGGRKLFFGLFVFPLLIAVGMAVLLCTVILLTHEDETPESLITAIKTGSPSKRWQKAFELSNELNRGRGTIRSEGLIKEVIHILGDVNHYDAKTRSYMAMALSHFHRPEAREALRRALKDESEDVELYALWALGVQQAREVVPDILPFLRNESDQLRKMAVYVLGVLGSRETVPAIQPCGTPAHYYKTHPDTKSDALIFCEARVYSPYTKSESVSNLLNLAKAPLYGGVFVFKKSIMAYKKNPPTTSAGSLMTASYELRPVARYSITFTVCAFALFD